MEEGEDIAWSGIQVCTSRRWESSPCWVNSLEGCSPLWVSELFMTKIEERLIRFFLKCISKGFFYLTQKKFNKFTREHQEWKQCKNLCRLPTTVNSVTKIWRPFLLWEYCWTGSAYNTVMLLLPQLHCLPQPSCTEISSELFYTCIFEISQKAPLVS